MGLGAFYGSGFSRSGQRIRARYRGASFHLCTGIENSYPIISGPDGKDVRRDGMELSHHYVHWRKDFLLVKRMGIQYLRYGPPYYRTHTAPV